MIILGLMAYCISGDQIFRPDNKINHYPSSGVHDAFTIPVRKIRQRIRWSL